MKGKPTNQTGVLSHLLPIPAVAAPSVDAVQATDSNFPAPNVFIVWQMSHGNSFSYNKS